MVLEHLLYKHVRLVQTSRFERQHKMCSRLENFLPCPTDIHKQFRR
jgi:hypothetical protein